MSGQVIGAFVFMGRASVCADSGQSTVRSSNGAVTSYVETWVQSSSAASQSNRAPQRMSMITHHQQNLLKSHQDVITALACIDAPFRGGIVSGDRAGVLKVWRVGTGE